MVFWLCDVHALQYTTANFGPDYFGAHYVPPSAAQVIATAPKNLVLIYVENILHFDLMPTILEFAGFSIPDGRLGLGYSAFNKHPSQPSAGRLHEMEKDLLNSSAEYLELWQKPDAPPASSQGPVAALSPAPSTIR